MTKDELKPIDISKYRITETGQVTRMTEEDLRKQATSTVEWENTPVLDRPLFVHAYITGAKPRENRIEELEKENAELEKQLTKAKGIIKDMLRILPKENIEGVYEITEEVEQFLKESE